MKGVIRSKREFRFRNVYHSKPTEHSVYSVLLWKAQFQSHRRFTWYYKMKISLSIFHVPAFTLLSFIFLMLWQYLGKGLFL